MKKRVLSFLLIAIMLVGMIPVNTVNAATTFVIGNGVTVPNSNVPADGSNKYCDDGKPVGTGIHYCCWNYAAKVYFHTWGISPNRYDNSTHYLRNVSSSERKLTADNLKKYLQNAAPGALLRLDVHSEPNTSDGDGGHSLIFVKMNTSGNGAYFLEGNYDNAGRSRLYEWKFSDLASRFGSRYPYIKYISWPNAPEYVACQHSTNKDLYNSVGVCTKCGAEYDFNSTYDTSCSGIYKVTLKSGIDLRASKPYSAADTNGVHIDYGTQVEVLGSVKNHWDNVWYKVSYNGKTGYTSADNLTLVSYGAQAITGSITSPTEGQTLSQAAYPVKGTITSKYPVFIVRAYIDGELYATVPGEKKTSIELQPTDVNYKLDFAKLSPGSHTIRIEARDIHHTDYVTVCTRKFYIEGTTTCSHSYVESVTTEATCDTDGVKLYKCSKCSSSYTETIPATGHLWGNWVINLEPTCEKYGISSSACNYCGIKTTERTEPLGHDWSDVQVEYPTCVSEGREYTVCFRCNAENTLSTTPANNSHAIGVETIEKPATCISSGTAYRSCVSCGYKMYYELPIDPEAHRWEEIITQQPTCVAPGELQRCCHECEKFEKVEIPVTDHLWSEWYENYPATEESEGEEYRNCENCGDTEYRAIPELESTVIPYPVEGGNIYFQKSTGTIISCDQSVTSANIPVVIDGVTVTNIGDAAFQFCSSLTSVIIPNSVTSIGGAAFYECNALTDIYYLGTEYEWYQVFIEDDFNDPLLNATVHFTECEHIYADWETIEFANCGYAGVERRWCYYCDSYEERVIVPTGEHKWDYWTLEGVPCEKDTVKSRRCMNCGMTETEEVPATGHNFEDWHVFEYAACLTDGTELRACRTCEKEESRVIPATGHDFGEWFINFEPTCSRVGMESRQCQNCSLTDTRDIPVNDNHNWGPWYTSKSPEIGIEGENRRDCYLCGSVETEKTPALEEPGECIHAWGEWVTVKEPTETEKGEQSRKCGSCDATETKELDIIAPPAPVNPFIDIKEGRWYTAGVLYCFANGYMTGVSEDTFDYKATMDRQMFATILAKIDGADTSAYTEMSFSDVKAGQWYSNAIEWAYQNGYASGMGEGIYGRKNPVTREQLAMFFYTYSEKNGIDVSGRASIEGYSDYDRIHSYALEAVAWAVDAGLISGTGAATLSPRDSATRGQVAVIVNSYVENVKNSD